MRWITTNNGATLTSFLVAITLSSLVGLMVIRLTGHQGKAMLVVSLLEEREQLLKYYANVLVEGWDKTRCPTSSPCPINISTNTPIAVYSRGGVEEIPTAGKELSSKVSSDPGSPNTPWLIKATATSVSSLANVEMGDYHSKGTEKVVKVKLVISFDSAKHWADVGNVIASREEWVYLHNANIKSKLTTNCISTTDRHPSQKDTRSSTTKDLYPKYSTAPNSAQGALTMFDFNNNSSKCSSVPLIQDHACPVNRPIIGFDSKGKPICSPASYVSVVTEQCLGAGNFIKKINTDGTVSCNTSARVAVANMVNRRSTLSGACGIRWFGDNESHFFRADWRTVPSGEQKGDRRRTRYHYPMYEAGGFQGLGVNGNMLGCVRFRYPNTSKGLVGIRGLPGRRGPRGFRGPTGYDGPRGDTPDPLRGFDGAINRTKGGKGSCYPRRCTYDSDCSFTGEGCDHYSQYNAVECTDNCECSCTIR